ncbi:MAG: hypothetical protein Kow0063_27150 [Anaerolineae bacterium]
MPSQPSTISWGTPVPDEAAFRQAFDPDYIRAFADQLSAIGLYELGFRPAGTPASYKAGELILQEMRRIGLQKVRREPFPVYAWDFRGVHIELHNPVRRTIPASSFPPSPGTSPAGLTAPLVDVGLGTAADYAGRDVRGKVVFARLDVNVMRWPGILVHEAELHGAIGVVFYYLNGYAQHPSGDALNTHDGMCRDTIPILQVSINDGHYLSDLLDQRGELEVTLISRVAANPQGTGYNVLGEIPGRRSPSHYLFVGAHYDAWFTGYWDNVSGVAAMLAIARALVDSGYQPEHTLVFLASDAEEFGVADSIFDWLVGAHALLEAHPEWVGQTTCCFNFDTLCLQVARKLGFYGSAEMVSFMRQSLAAPDMILHTFAEPQAEVENYVTPWTETYSWTYFGIPVVQPRFDRGTAGETHYHTQFDTADILDFDKTNEAVRMCGSLLVHLDRLPLPPFDFVTRAEAMRASVDWDVARTLDMADRLAQALDGFEERARQLTLALKRVTAGGWPALVDQTAAVEAARAQLLDVARYLLLHGSYLGGDFSHEVMYRHVNGQRHLATLDQAIAALEAGDAARTLEVLCDKASGLPGAFFGQHVSYPTYHHFTLGAVNPGRSDLLWGKDRALPYLDCWMVIHDLKDRLARGSQDFGPELHTLREQRQVVVDRLRQDLVYLAEIVETAAGQLPVSELQDLAALV